MNRDQCQATTNNGQRCTRMVKEGQKFCWQHEPQFQRRLRQLSWVGIISVVITVIGLWADLTGLSFLPGWPRNETMPGAFRIAIAEFDTAPNSRSNVGRELSEVIYLQIEQSLDELNPDYSITIWGPKQVGSIRGNTAEQRSAAAAKRAAEIGADIIVYGSVDTSQPNWRITPEFYIRDANLFDLAELTGHYQLGDPFFVSGQGNIATRFGVSQRVSERTTLLAQLTVALSFYASEEYAEALNRLESTLSSNNWTELGGQPLLYVLLGNAAGKSGDLQRAEEAYSSAITLDPEYSRGYLGLASTYYAQALPPAQENNNLADADTELLIQAINMYDRAEMVSNIPPLSDTAIKAHFGRGQAYTILGFSDDSELFNQAVFELREVINEFNQSGNARIQSLAGEAHGRLGLIYSYAAQPEQAIREYEAAVRLLSNSPSRQTVYQQAINELSAKTDN